MQSNELYRLAYGFHLATRQYAKGFSVGPWRLDTSIGQVSLLYSDPKLEGGTGFIEFSATSRELTFCFHDLLLERAKDDIAELTNRILDLFFPDAHMCLVDTGEPGARACFSLMRYNSDWRNDFEYFGGGALSRHRCSLQLTPQAQQPEPQPLTFDMMRGCL